MIIAEWVINQTLHPLIAFCLFYKQEIARSEVRSVVSSKKIFHDFQERMVHWMSENYGRILDLFRRFDSDNSGKLSYEEFADGMRDLGKPV